MSKEVLSVLRNKTKRQLIEWLIVHYVNACIYIYGYAEVGDTEKFLRERLLG